MVWRCRKVADSGSLISGLARAGRHLDVVAQDIVVPHLQRLDAGRRRHTWPRARPSPCGCRREAARLVEVGAVAGAHEAAVAAQMRRLIDEGAREQRFSSPDARRSGAARCAASASGRPMPPARVRSRPAQALAAASPSRTAARSRGSPRCKASREMARAISGAARSAARRSSRRVSFSRRNPTASSRAAIACGSRRGPGSRAASSRAPGPVTVRSMAASRLPCRSPRASAAAPGSRGVGASMTRRLAGPARAAAAGTAAGRSASARRT